MDKRVDATHPALPEGLRKIRDWLVAGPRVDLIGETWSASRLGETFTTLNLASEETLVQVAAGDAAAVDAPGLRRALGAARLSRPRLPEQVRFGSVIAGRLCGRYALIVIQR